jgi:hypothetical protein
VASEGDAREASRPRDLVLSVASSSCQQEDDAYGADALARARRPSWSQPTLWLRVFRRCAGSPAKDLTSARRGHATRAWCRARRPGGLRLIVVAQRAAVAARGEHAAVRKQRQIDLLSGNAIDDTRRQTRDGPIRSMTPLSS